MKPFFIIMNFLVTCTLWCIADDLHSAYLRQSARYEADIAAYKSTTRDFAESVEELNETFNSALDSFREQLKAMRPEKVRIMRITGYVPGSAKTAIQTTPIVGRTAAVSPACKDWLGSRVYVHGVGVFRVEDVTAVWADTKFDLCTLDITVPRTELTAAVTHPRKEVVRLD